MFLKKTAAAFFALLGTGFAALAVAVCLLFSDASPILLIPADAAEAKTEALMEALCAGDYAGAESCLFGQPDLGANREDVNSVSDIVWQAWLECLDYEFTSPCYPSEAGLSRDVTVTCLDLGSITGTIGPHAQAILEEFIAEAGTLSELYTEDGSFREELVTDVLYLAALQSLFEDAQLVRQELTLDLVFYQGQWWVQPSQALLSTISGGTAG